MIQYATIDQFFEFQGQTREQPAPTSPDTAADEIAEFDAETLRLNALLKRASSRIRSTTRLARVRYLSTGLPQSDRIAEAFADATCAQAVWFEDNGDATGAGSVYDNVSLIGVSFGKQAGTGGQSSSSSAGDSRISPEANEILSNAGIFTTAVRH